MRASKAPVKREWRNNYYKVLERQNKLLGKPKYEVRIFGQGQFTVDHDRLVDLADLLDDICDELGDEAS